MKLFLMRHGEASFDASTDRQRPLTPLGVTQTQQMAAHLASRIAQLDQVFVSPYLRAQQSWQACEVLLPKAQKIHTLNELVPEACPQTAHDLLLAYMDVQGAETGLVIAHMPLLGYLVSEFVPAEAPPLFATSALAQIELKPTPTLISLQGPSDLALVG
ncbi:phosphohistidine phosphatase, SixA [Ferrimonas balearica DSM 9799]|uniref:Phosphohistidine phosphatase, SixA n=1 Tax=Ferrimonas balearica (strain DSM 9799 / CCM 4581 / KCTC 23876 / PAT) TaxID=550540 RepID=E1SQ54_FERBD|nr:phosphohistidine phosphatase SixA [Ferrimonas balearica]ADN76826.1 phosphohistidine phosphatase, SixA [Ferrimonas balearica DSM 9799]